MLSHISKKITSTPFYEDMMKDGTVIAPITASKKGIEREQLKSRIWHLQKQVTDNKISANDALIQYDIFSANFTFKDIVNNKRQMLIKMVSTSSNVNYDTTLHDQNCDDKIYVLKLRNDSYYVCRTPDIELYLRENKLDNMHNSVNLTNVETAVDAMDISDIVKDATDISDIVKDVLDVENDVHEINVVESYLYTSPFDEDYIVKKLMSNYGITNVRGGSYRAPDLTLCQILNIQSELLYAQGTHISCNGNTDIKDVNEEYIQTFLLSKFSKIANDEIARLLSLRSSTIELHLRKCDQYGIMLISE